MVKTYTALWKLHKYRQCKLICRINQLHQFRRGGHWQIATTLVQIDDWLYRNAWHFCSRVLFMNWLSSLVGTQHGFYMHTVHSAELQTTTNNVHASNFESIAHPLNIHNYLRMHAVIPTLISLQNPTHIIEYADRPLPPPCSCNIIHYMPMHSRINYALPRATRPQRCARV